jgi:GDP-L-fucose synthase
MREDAVWDGLPEPTNGPYGQSKRLLMSMGEAYHAQYGFRAVFPMPVNLYGPRDCFDPERSHVVPGLIRRFVSAREQDLPEVVAWGTGTVTRELLYAPDCAEAIVLCAERLEDPAPVNLGTGVELRVSAIAQAVADAVGYRGAIVWDATKPDGQPRKCLDISRAEALLGWRAKTALPEGLAQTVAWFIQDRAQRS